VASPNKRPSLGISAYIDKFISVGIITELPEFIPSGGGREGGPSPASYLLGLGLGTHLFVKVPRPGDSEGTFSVFSQAATCYYQSNHSKVETIPLSA